MDNACQKQTVMLSRPVMDIHEEYVLSGDFVLPEYCPDVAVVLKCVLTPYISGRQWNGDQLMLEGTAALRILYLDEERQCVREAEFSQPISCALRGEGNPQGTMVQTELVPAYANCRATSPRRLEVHAAFMIHARGMQAEEQELVSATQEQGVYMQTMPICTTAPKAWAERMTVVNEVLDFDSTLPEAEQLLGGYCEATVQECKLLSGKAIVKGHVFVHQLYTDDSARGSTHVLEYTLPFSQILDVDGVNEGDLATAAVTLLSDTQRTAIGSTGQNTAIEVTVKLLIQVQVHGTTECMLVTDAYHGRFPMELHRRPIPLQCLMGIQRQNAMVQKNMELPSTDMKEILDLWVQPVASPTVCQDGKAQLSGRLLISMLVRLADDSIAYYERPEEFQLEYPIQGDAVDACYRVMGVQYTATDSHLELRVQLAIGMDMWSRQTVEAVDTMTLQEDCAYPAENAAVKLYFAQPGERVWDIARECHASPTALREENDLREDIIQKKTALLIPMV